MTAQLNPSLAACPGCLVVPRDAVEDAPEAARLALSLPGIHCQACIASVENGLNAVPGVVSARVNLTLKRALIEAEPDMQATDLIPVLTKLGFEAHELVWAC